MCWRRFSKFQINRTIASFLFQLIGQIGKEQMVSCCRFIFKTNFALLSFFFENFIIKKKATFKLCMEIRKNIHYQNVFTKLVASIQFTGKFSKDISIIILATSGSC